MADSLCLKIPRDDVDDGQVFVVGGGCRFGEGDRRESCSNWRLEGQLEGRKVSWKAGRSVGRLEGQLEGWRVSWKAGGSVGRLEEVGVEWDGGCLEAFLATATIGL
jgi:hypothetical protein